MFIKTQLASTQAKFTDLQQDLIQVKSQLETTQADLLQCQEDVADSDPGSRSKSKNNNKQSSWKRSRDVKNLPIPETMIPNKKIAIAVRQSDDFFEKSPQNVQQLKERFRLDHQWYSVDTLLRYITTVEKSHTIWRSILEQSKLIQYDVQRKQWICDQRQFLVIVDYLSHANQRAEELKYQLLCNGLKNA
jgi:hypothetical protein